MGEDGINRLIRVLWQGKLYIVMALALTVVAVIAAYSFFEARDLSYRLDQKVTDYTALDEKYNKLSSDYNKLSSDHSALAADNDDLKRRYTALNDDYKELSTDKESLQASYNDLNGKVNRMHETGGPSFAVRYNFYEGGPSNDRKNYLEVWIYNIGDGKEDRVTVKARTINADNSTSISEQTFNDVEALDKRHVKWDYSTLTRLDSVWCET